MSNTISNVTGTPDTDPAKLNADAVVAQLRTLRSQIEDVAPLSKEQRKLIQQRLRLLPKTVVEASINVIGVLENVSQAIGQPLDDVRQVAGRLASMGGRCRRGPRIPERDRGSKPQPPSTAGAHRDAGVRDRVTAGEGPGQGRAPAARRGGQTAERGLAPQEGDTSTSNAVANFAAGAHHVHRTTRVE